MVDNLFLFGLTQTFTNMSRVSLLQTDISIDRHTDHVATISILCFRNFVELFTLLALDNN